MAFLRPLAGATGYLLPGVVVMSKPKGQKPQAALAGGYEHPAFAYRKAAPTVKPHEVPYVPFFSEHYFMPSLPLKPHLFKSL